jgi:two-component system sensor histidine kinase TorS
MSAHVFAQEVETYLASGMVSYVPKPLTPEALAGAIAQAQGTPVSIRAIDEAAWQADLAALGADQMRKILAISAKTLPERLSDLRVALAANDAPRLASVAHAAFSSASAAGFSLLQQIFARIETAARNGDIEACRLSVAGLADLISETLAEATKFLAEDEKSARPARVEPRRDSPLRVR